MLMFERASSRPAQGQGVIWRGHCGNFNCTSRRSDRESQGRPRTKATARGDGSCSLTGAQRTTQHVFETQPSHFTLLVCKHPCGNSAFGAPHHTTPHHTTPHHTTPHHTTPHHTTPCHITYVRSHRVRSSHHTTDAKSRRLPNQEAGRKSSTFCNDKVQHVLCPMYNRHNSHEASPTRPRDDFSSAQQPHSKHCPFAANQITDGCEGAFRQPTTTSIHRQPPIVMWVHRQVTLKFTVSPLQPAAMPWSLAVAEMPLGTHD